MKRREFIAAGVAGALVPRVMRRPYYVAAPRPRPSDAQLEWQRDELALFLHFGVNTFTNPVGRRNRGSSDLQS